MLHGLWRVSNGRILPWEADQLEIWEIAVLLGHATELDSGDSKADAKVAREAFRASSHDRLRQRLAHHRGQGDAPETKPTAPSVLAALSL